MMSQPTGLAGGDEAAYQGSRRLRQEEEQVQGRVTICHGEGYGTGYQDDRQPARKPRDPPGGCGLGLRRDLLPAPLLEVA
jgi:hypothetical protein